MPFQTQVNQQPAPGIAGDFASTNPRSNVLAGPGGLVAGAAGVNCGYFGWRDQTTLTQVSNFGTGAPDGFCHNAHNGLITAYLGSTSLNVPVGFQFGDLFDGGDFWITNNGSGPAGPGMVAYANNSTGAASFAPAGTPPTSGNGTTSSIAEETFTVTGSLAVVPNNVGPGTNPGVFTAASGLTGTIYVGAAISGTGIAAGTVITGLGTGTGGLGTYYVNIPQAVASTAITGEYGLLTVGGTVTGTFGVNDSISGTNVTTGSTITALGTGTGGAGTYVTQYQTTSGNQSITAQSATQTTWTCQSFGQVGEVVKISAAA